MAINRTPVLKRCRQLGLDPVVLGYSSSKTSKREPKRRRKESEYGMQLREKQKVKFIYGVLEKQFHGYFEKAKAMPGITGENLMRILESRLDSVIFRLGFARTRKEARQIVTHGHIMVNGRRVDVPSYRVKAGDVVSVAPKSKELLVIKSALVSHARFKSLCCLLSSSSAPAIFFCLPAALYSATTRLISSLVGLVMASIALR